MKLLIVIASLLVVSCSAALTSEWHAFKTKHGKSYDDAVTDENRRQLWQQSLTKVQEHNLRYEAGEVSYFLGINFMSDMTMEEKKRYTGHAQAMPKKLATTHRKGFGVPKPLPKSVDWRMKGAVNAVKDQGDCGSCWAFSAIASIEGQYFMKNQKLVSFSEQQVVDCDTESSGCDGGLMDYAFRYLLTSGLETEKSYPYHAKDQKCAYKKSAALLKPIHNWVDIESNSEMALQQAIATVGPISVAIDASQKDFHDYAGGVYDNKDCSSTDLDHGVAAVGFGTTKDGKDYYIVRNSWTTEWGVEGYILMARNDENRCGIATEASYPVL